MCEDSKKTPAGSGHAIQAGVYRPAHAGAEFHGSPPIAVDVSTHLRGATGKSVDSVRAHLLDAISALTLPLRPGRIEPHAIKRRPKNHALLLTVPRHVARPAIIRARRAYAQGSAMTSHLIKKPTRHPILRWGRVDNHVERGLTP
jgi:hypothetical protein